MFALTFSAGGKLCAVDLKYVCTVSPAFDLHADASRPLPFVGWHGDGDSKIPAFDLNYAITGKPAERLFGTRHIIATPRGDSEKIALVAERVGQVAEFPESALSGAEGDAYRSAEYGGNSLALVDIAKVLEGAL